MGIQERKIHYSMALHIASMKPTIIKVGLLQRWCKKSIIVFVTTAVLFLSVNKRKVQQEQFYLKDSKFPSCSQLSLQ